MRPWRKLHSSILESERFMDVSTEAKLLFMLLVTAQDDTGYFPWERMKVRRLVAACGWSADQAKKHADALVTGEMATWEEGGIILFNGKELNGNPREDRTPFIYQRSTTDGHLTVTDERLPAAVTRKKQMIETDDRRKKQNKEAPTALFVLPEWVDKDLWADFLEMRKRKRAKPTEKAVALLIAELDKFRAAGDDPDEVLRRSIMNNWTGVFPLNRSDNGKSGRHNPTGSGRDNASGGEHPSPFDDPKYKGVVHSPRSQ